MYINKEYIPTFFQKPPTKSKDIHDDDVQGNSCMDCLHPAGTSPRAYGPQVKDNSSNFGFFWC